MFILSHRKFVALRLSANALDTSQLDTEPLHLDELIDARGSEPRKVRNILVGKQGRFLLANLPTLTPCIHDEELSQVHPMVPDAFVPSYQEKTISEAGAVAALAES